ncbi:MAG TPA: lytic transglycosylase domain-containing protein [Bryobacteraceae bacterium]|nr:lytic transglycosylase domain-containing protein [Bryobacteraceae bacterium]
MKKFEILDKRRLEPISTIVKLLSLLLVLAPCWGADLARPSAEAQRRSVASMEASLAQQRAAVARMRAAVLRQRESAPPVSSPLSLVQPAPARVAGRGCEPLPEAQLGYLIAEAGAREGLATTLLRAVIEKESSALPCAVSRKGALGLMQLMPATVAGLDVEDPFDPKENVDAGAKLLKQLLVRYGGDVALALGAYNAGPSRVDQAGNVPAIRETMDYVNHILARIGASPDESAP